MTDEPTYAYVEGSLLHLYPAYEECNLDDATEVHKLTQAEVKEHERLFGGYTRCLHCFGTVTAASGVQFDVLRDDPDEDAPINAG